MDKMALVTIHRDSSAQPHLSLTQPLTEVNGAAVLNLDCDCCALAPNKPGDFTIAGVGAPLGDKLKRLERVEEGLKKQYPGTPH